MASATEYEERIQRFDHAETMRLWEAIQAGDTPHWDSGKAFEYMILRAFQLEGAQIEWPYSVRDDDGLELEQIDGAIFSQGIHYLVEAKDYRKPLNVGPIAKLRNQLWRRPALAIGIVFSRSGFTSAASTLAGYVAPQTILLWDGVDIDLSLKKQAMVDGLKRKYRYAITHGFPDLNLSQ